jgi:hypothetical protein
MPSATATWRNDTYAAISPLRPELGAQGKTVVITGAVSPSLGPFIIGGFHLITIPSHLG